VKHAKAIYKKELLDTLRDRRTLATMLLVPMVGYPLTLIFTSETIAVRQREGAARTISVMASREVPEALAEALGRNSALHVERSHVATATNARAVLATGDVDVLLTAPFGSTDVLSSTGTVDLTVFYDLTRAHSDSAIIRVEEALKTVAADMRDDRLRIRRLPPSIAEPLSLETKSVSTDSEVGNNLAGSILPALVVLFIAVSSFYPAVDLTAGEKERKTLATLLCAPVAPIDLVAGKYLAVLTVGTFAGMLNVVVLALTLLRVIASGAPASNAPTFALSVSMMFGLLGCVVLVAMPIAALMLLFGTLARSFRDASNLLTPVILLSSVPSVMASLPGTELTARSALVPLANAALLMKAILLGRADAGSAVIAVVSTLVVTAMLLLFAARTFADERVLFSTEGKRADLKSVLFSPPPLGVSTALAFSGLAFVATYYAGLLSSGSAPLPLVVLTQLLAHFLPALLLAKWLAPSIAPKELLLLRAPPPIVLVSAVLIGAGAWLGLSLPIAWLTEVLLPGQEEAARAFSEALGIHRIPLYASILAFAVLPAIAEELAFRGVVLSLLSRTLSPRTALLVQALIFGAMHGSIYRILPTAMLGLLLGLLAQRSRSILPGMLAHALTNAILLSLERVGPPRLLEEISKPTPYALAGVLLVGIGFVLRHRQDANFETTHRRSDERR
jgi:sodium transport system permease protein